MNAKLVSQIVITASLLGLSRPAFADGARRAPAPAAKAQAAAPAAAPASRAPASIMQNDPNKAVEIRGQSRTLSMMLVLKNGKENINFIKVRKDYAAEIKGTEF